MWETLLSLVSTPQNQHKFNSFFLKEINIIDSVDALLPSISSSFSGEIIILQLVCLLPGFFIL